MSAWQQANAGINAYLVLKVMPSYRTCSVQPNGWYQYSSLLASDAQGKNSFTVSPGYWKKGDASARLPRDLNRWSNDVRSMVSPSAQIFN